MLAATAAAAQAGPLMGMPQRDLLGRRIDRLASTPSAGGSSSGEMPSLPLSARGAARYRPSPAGTAAVLPAATPLSAHLHMRRARTMTSRDRGAAEAAAAADLAAKGLPSARRPPGGREDVLAHLQRGSGAPM